jgi:hypothetical protein
MDRAPWFTRCLRERTLLISGWVFLLGDVRFQYFIIQRVVLGAFEARVIHDLNPENFSEYQSSCKKPS